MFNLSKLYLKIYLYFLIVVILLTLVVPTVLFASFNKSSPPHIHMLQKILSIMSFMKKHSPGDKGFTEELKNISEETIISFYDKNGRLLFTTGNMKQGDISSGIINMVEKGGTYSFPPPFNDKPEILMAIDNPGYPYMSISMPPRPFSTLHFFLTMVVISLLLSIMVYPMVRYLTKPLEEITEKALKFSSGDFTGIDKNVTTHNGGDEIAKLTETFYYMAKELSVIIEGKKEMISDISHELGSPLSRMQVAVEIIEDKLKTGEMPSLKIVNKLSKNISEMSKLVKELLDISRMDKGYVLTFEEVNLEEVVSNIIQKFQLLLEKNKLSVNIHKDGNLNVSIDCGRITRVIENLLSNAIDYSPQGGQIDIFFKEKDGYFSLSIKDEGPGISMENKEKVFEPFFREDPSRTRQTGGTGLGLAIVKKIISLHGGTIFVEPPKEKGTTITFQIPTAKG